MEKKCSNRFTIQFNDIDEQHMFVANILNSLPPRKRAVYIAQAIYAYENGSNKKTTQKPFLVKRGRVTEVGQEKANTNTNNKASSHKMKVQKTDKKSKRTEINPANPDSVSDDMLGSMMSFVHNS